MRLNLPEYDFNIKKSNGTHVIYDPLRRRYVTLTPEEWVRQHFVQFLVHERNFPFALMANEVSIMQNGIKRRCDTLVADRHGKPFVIIEYKSPQVQVTQTTFNQIVRYNMVLHAKYLIVSNGIKHYCCMIDYSNNTYKFLADIPTYDVM